MPFVIHRRSIQTMAWRIKTATIVTGVVVCLVTLGEVNACSCFPPDFCLQVTEQSDLLVRANIISSSSPNATEDELLPDVTYLAEWTTLYRSETGVSYGSLLNFTTPGSSARCGIYLELETEYLLDITVQENEGTPDTLVAYACGATQMWDTLSAEQLYVLENGCVDSSAGNYTYLGCYSHSSGDPLLTGPSTMDDLNMTTEVCAAFCEGSTYFGTGNGDECYCSDASDSITNATLSSCCNLSCAGDAAATCGGSDAISMYGTAVNLSSGVSPTTEATDIDSSDCEIVGAEADVSGASRRGRGAVAVSFAITVLVNALRGHAS